MLPAIRRRLSLMPVLLVAALLPAASLVVTGRAGAADVQPETISPLLQVALEEPLKRRVSELLAERNDKGEQFRRGGYSPRLRRIDDETYQAAFHRETASPERLLVERFLITLKPGVARGSWAIASEDLQDSYSNLYRTTPGNEEFLSFERFSYSLEGLTVTATNGALYRVPFMGKPSRLTLVADDLAYDYVPPVPQEKMLYAILKDERAGDLVFSPERVSFVCDPVSCEKLISTAFTGLTPITREASSTALKQAYEKYLDGTRDDRTGDGFSGFTLPWEPDHRVMLATIKKKMSDQRIWLASDSHQAKEVSFGVGGLGPVYAYYSAETRAKNLPADQLERRDDADGRDYDLERITGKVEMGLDDPESLTADLIYSLTSKRELREIPFSISRLRSARSTTREAKNPKMTIHSIEDENGQEMTWVKTGPFAGLLVLPKPIEAGTNLVFRMQFVNKDSIYKLSPTFSYVDREGWLPFVRLSDMLDAFDLTVTVPARYETLGVGEKVEEVEGKGTRTTSWVSSAPVDFPTVIYGDYLDDKAAFKATKSNGVEIPVTIHVDKTSITAKPVPRNEEEESMRTGAEWEIRPKQLRALADDAANALNLYREVFGVDYPYAKLDLVNDPMGSLYGQSPASIVYLGSAAFRGEGTLGGGTSAGEATKFVKSLVAHEVAHQWWGSLVANANDRNYWWVESLAEYSSALFVEAKYGRKRYLAHVASWRKEILDADLQVSVQDAPVLWSNGALGYRAALYAQGPYMFHIMRSTWGDEKFFAFLKTLAHEEQGREIVTRDIQKIAERTFGGTMEWFFDQWIRGVGLPEYTVEYTTRPAEDKGYFVEGKITQRVLVGTKKHPLANVYYRAVAPLSVVGKSGKEYQAKLKIEGPETPFRLKFPEPVSQVKFNDGGEVLTCDMIMKGGA
jgi:peptidase M1-like protein